MNYLEELRAIVDWRCYEVFFSFCLCSYKDNFVVKLKIKINLYARSDSFSYRDVVFYSIVFNTYVFGEEATVIDLLTCYNYFFRLYISWWTDPIFRSSDISSYFVNLFDSLVELLERLEFSMAFDLENL